MTASPAPRPRNLLRRLERWAVGLAMGMIALVLERVVVRSIKKGRTKPKADRGDPFVTTKGSEATQAPPES